MDREENIMKEIEDFLDALVHQRISTKKDNNGFVRIETLEKEKKQFFRKKEEFVFSFEKKPILELGYHTRQKKRNLIYKFIIRRIINQLVYPAIEEDRTEELFDLIHNSIRLEMKPIDITKSRKEHVYRNLYGKSDVFHINLWVDEKRVFSAVGGTLEKPRYHHGNFKDNGERIVDVNTLFAEILFVSTVKERFESVDKNNATYTQCCNIWEKFPESVQKNLNSDEPSVTGTFLLFKRPFLQNFLADFFMIFAEDYAEESAVFRFEKQNYAKSYETKRNLPKKITAAMNSSLFHAVFSYVEYDEAVDLVNVRKIENEFISLNKAVFQKRLMKGYSLRFRRLGCHKASGMYYPTKKCMCVDIGHPDAFVHEFFHMLDYAAGTASKKTDFWDIYQKYISAFIAGISLEELEELKKSTGRKNYQYYKRKTEVFARCGEIYVSRILGIKTSLVGKTDTFEYPENKELDAMIQKYFSAFLRRKEE